jgi:HNH endonuclease
MVDDGRRGKPCRKCGADEWQPRKDGGWRCVPCQRSQCVRWQAANREKVRTRMAKWRTENPKKVRASHAKYRAAHPEKRRATEARWRIENRETARARQAKYRATNVAKVRATAAKWLRDNPEKRQAVEATRRARKLSAPGRGVTTAQWHEVVQAANGRCVYCGERRLLSMDHIEPLSRGGAHDADNIAAACKPCNSSKNDTSLLLWLACYQRNG